jgi:hypothetical protein
MKLLLDLRCGNQQTAFIDNMFRKYAAIIKSFELESAMACLELY